MASARRYKILCPIARALDAVGDRWDLLILRDLHAGPARFKDLQTGLPGIATNLLADRLVKLADIDLIEKIETQLGVTVYALTPRGAKTRNLLFELSQFGTQFPPDPDVKPTTSYRTVAVTMAAMLERGATADDRLRLQLNIGGEPYCITVRGTQTAMALGPCENPEAVLSTTYDALLAVGDGALPPDAFSREHLTLIDGDPDALQRFLTLFVRALTHLGGAEDGED